MAKTKLEAAQRLRELANKVMEPWLEIHGLVLEMDSSHNRIWGLGVKTHSIRAHDAILVAAKSFEDEHNREAKATYIDTDTNKDDLIFPD